MVQGAWAYQLKHIPGSSNASAIKMLKEQLQPEDDLIVYCTNPQCGASQYAYHQLVAKGYKIVRRYDGGFENWEAAGDALEQGVLEQRTHQLAA